MGSTPTQPIKLQFGLSAAVPPSAKAAWGARLIFPADLLHDRQGFHNWDTPDGIRLKDWLNVRGALKAALAQARRLASNFTMTPDENTGFILFEDEVGIIMGNPLASFGYCYVAAYLKYEAPATTALIPEAEPIAKKTRRRKAVVC